MKSTRTGFPLESIICVLGKSPRHSLSWQISHVDKQAFYQVWISSTVVWFGLLLISSMDFIYSCMVWFVVVFKYVFQLQFLTNKLYQIRFTHQLLVVDSYFTRDAGYVV